MFNYIRHKIAKPTPATVEPHLVSMRMAEALRDIKDRVDLQVSIFTEDKEKANLFVSYRKYQSIVSHFAHCWLLRKSYSFNILNLNETVPFLTLRALSDICSHEQFDRKAGQEVTIGTVRGSFGFNGEVFKVANGTYTGRTFSQYCKLLFNLTFNILLNPRDGDNVELLDGYLTLIGAASHPNMRLLVGLSFISLSAFIHLRTHSTTKKLK